jgi:carboxyl-terminal processing protease
MQTMRVRTLRAVLLVVMIFGMGFLVGNHNSLLRAQSDTTPPREAQRPFEAFWQVYNLIQDSYLDRDSISTEALVDGAIQGMMDVLGDDFSGYMDPEVFPYLNTDLSGEVEGIGAIVETLEGSTEIRIVSVFDGSPAQKAGIKAGDVFVKVDGIDVTKLGQFELVSKVRGPEGTVVLLTMRRGDELIDFKVTRAKITVPTVEYRVLDGGIGYIRLREFNQNAYQQIKDAIQDLKTSDLTGIVLDLRNNPGGLLSSAIDVASLFIPEGTILIEDFGNNNQEIFKARTDKYVELDVPLTVLVDETSASASELVAGALQDQGKATIIGVTTFGKGTVQTWQTLVNGGGVRLTVARWLTPNGNWIHENGITPDIIVEWPHEERNSDLDPQLEAAINYLKTETAQPTVSR